MGRQTLQSHGSDTDVERSTAPGDSIDEASHSIEDCETVHACVIRREDSGEEWRAAAVVGTGASSADAVEQAVRETVHSAFRLEVDTVATLTADAVPETVAGDVDRRLLAERLAPQTASAQEAIAPQPTAVAADTPSAPHRATLRRIWEEVLGPGSAEDPDADFRALGGESLRSLQLFSRLDEAFGSRVDPRAFYRNPTLAGLGALIEAEHTASADEPDIWPLSARQHRSLLVFTESWPGRRVTKDRLVASFNTDGRRVPIFFVGQVEFEVRDLARELGSDQPVHGFRSGYMVTSRREEDIQALALRYAADIQEVWPDGPILIAGACQGGIVAQAMAEHLLHRGRDVRLLALMEWGFNLRSYPGRVLLLYGQESRFSSPYRRFSEPDRAWSRRYGEVSAVALPDAAYRELFDAKYVTSTAASLADACAQALARPPLEVPVDGRRAAIRLAAPPASLKPGQPLTIALTLKNRSAYAWLETESSGLMLGSYWVDDLEETLQPSDGRCLLPRIEAGASVELGLTITAPRNAGRFLLVVDVVEEGNTWFDPARTEGAAALPVEVVPDAPDDPRSERAGASGDPHLVIDGTARFGRVCADELLFSVPRGARSVRLVSARTPAAAPDVRTLGVLISQISVEDHAHVRDVALDDPALSAGFFDIERGEASSWCWTDGDAEILPTLWAGMKGDFILRFRGMFPPRAASREDGLADPKRDRTHAP